MYDNGIAWMVAHGSPSELETATWRRDVAQRREVRAAHGTTPSALRRLVDRVTAFARPVGEPAADLACC
jgi:hypothetical protein